MFIIIIIFIIISKVLDINGTSLLLTTDLAEDKTYMKWCNYWDQVVITIIIIIIIINRPWPAGLEMIVGR